MTRPQVNAILSDVAFVSVICDICSEKVTCGLIVSIPECKHRFHNSCFVKALQPREIGSLAVDDADRRVRRRHGTGLDGDGDAASSRSEHTLENEKIAGSDPPESGVSEDVPTPARADAGLAAPMCPKCGLMLVNSWAHKQHESGAKWSG